MAGLFQILTAVEITYPTVVWPLSWMDVLHAFKFVNLDFLSLVPDVCVIDVTHTSRLLWVTLGPLCGLLLLAVVAQCMYRKMTTGIWAKRAVWLKRKVIPVTLVVTFSIYPSVSATVSAPNGSASPPCVLGAPRLQWAWRSTRAGAPPPRLEWCPGRAAQGGPYSRASRARS